MAECSEPRPRVSRIPLVDFSTQSVLPGDAKKEEIVMIPAVLREGLAMSCKVERGDGKWEQVLSNCNNGMDLSRGFWAQP